MHLCPSKGNLCLGNARCVAKRTMASRKKLCRVKYKNVDLHLYVIPVLIIPYIVILINITAIIRI
jgi:hypothetical protein